MFIEDMPDGYRVHVERNIENQWSVRITEIKIGHKYVIVGPLYSKQQHMAGRECTVTYFIENKCGFTDKAKVRYIDTNRVGQVSLRNLAGNEIFIT